MLKRRGLLSTKWLILILGTGMVLFYQNMSWVDIRDYAPAPPQAAEGSHHQYLPTRLNGNSVESLGQGILSHNLDPWFQQFEAKYLRSETPYFGVSFFRTSSRSQNSAEVISIGQNDHFVQNSIFGWNFSLISADRVRLTVFTQWNGRELKMIAESKSTEAGVKISMNHPLSQSMELGFQHQTSLGQSELLWSYRF